MDFIVPLPGVKESRAEVEEKKDNLYKITVRTGSKTNAATTANVRHKVSQLGHFRGSRGGPRNSSRVGGGGGVCMGLGRNSSKGVGVRVRSAGIFIY